MTVFDPATAAQHLKAQTKLIRKPSYRQRQSRLDRYAGELIALHREGCSVAELQRWLRSKRIKVVHTTVARWLSRHR